MSDLENNKRVVAAFVETVFNRHKVDEGIERFMGPYFIEHNPGVGDGVEAFRTFFTKFFAERPQTRFEIKRTFCEGDFVTVHAHWTDNPADRGLAVMDIFRMEKGRIVEHWDVIQPIPESMAHDNTMF